MPRMKTHDETHLAARAAVYARAALVFLVMAGLVPVVHAFSEAPQIRRGCPAQGRA
jgi:hypothetical protein